MASSLLKNWCVKRHIKRRASKLLRFFSDGFALESLFVPVNDAQSGSLRRGAPLLARKLFDVAYHIETRKCGGMEAFVLQIRFYLLLNCKKAPPTS